MSILRKAIYRFNALSIKKHEDLADQVSELREQMVHQRGNERVKGR